MTDVVVTTDAVVRDGSTVCLRPAEERDVETLVQLLNALSPESRYFRFFGVPTLNTARGRLPGGYSRRQRQYTNC
jgi:hypothetical protein